MLDRRAWAKSPAKFGLTEQIFYGLTLVSPLSFVSGTPAFLKGRHVSFLRYIVLFLNLSLAAYLTAMVLLVYPYTNAWACYPSRDVRSFRWGYCPQYTGDIPAFNEACKQLNFPPLCNSKTWDRHPRTIHSELDASVHAAFHVIVMSVAAYVAQIPGVVYDMKSHVCRKQQ